MNIENIKSHISRIHDNIKNSFIEVNEKTTNVETNISTHNTSNTSHNDIRLLVEGLTTRLNTLANSDDTTLDQLSEIVAYIKNNKSLIEGITTSKVNVSDIIDNLTTSANNKPLSAKMGVQLKSLIDAIKMPTKTSQLTNDSGYITEVSMEDKNDIAQIVLEILGGDPVRGYVDADNNIIVQGRLAEGTYFIKYEMDDGSTIDIGNLVLDTNVYYSVTSNLTNCKNSNSTREVVEGSTYSATITANDGYELKTVTVTMGGQSVSVSGGNISIANVTGNIVITAVANEIEVPTSRLPSEYQEVEWVQIINAEDVGHNQCMHTDIKWNTVNKIIIKIQNVTSSNVKDMIISSWTDATTKAAPYVSTRTDKTPNTMYGYVSGLTNYAVSPSNIVATDTDAREYTMTFTASATTDICFGGWDDRSLSHPHKWYYMEVYNGDTLLGNFIPCYRIADNINGFYDLVSGKFYTEAGYDSGTNAEFLYRGNEVM